MEYLVLVLFGLIDLMNISKQDIKTVGIGNLMSMAVLIFTAGTPSLVTNYTSTNIAVLSLRAAPSVDNGVTGALGQRELINRMQLTLRQLGLIANGSFFVRLVLNPRFVTNAPTFTSVGGSSLSQTVYHPANTQITGGETIFAFYSQQGGGGRDFANTTLDLDLVRDLGNSILGGGTSNTLDLTSATSRGYNGIYPDGPDIITVVVQNTQQSVVVSPTTVTLGSPIAVFADVSGFSTGWVVETTAGGIPGNNTVLAITARAGGGFDVAFSKNAISGSAAITTFRPPGQISARLSWTEAQA
jgi:hypothetical protein